MQIRDRIKELRRVPASELLPNPKNWRTHPVAQQDALRGVLAEVGYAEALIARETPEGLMLVDGHLRAETTPDSEVPVLVLDIDEAEADLMLATLDPLAAMAGRDEERLAELLATVSSENEAVLSLFAGLKDFDHVDINSGSFAGPMVDTSTGEHASDIVGYDLGSVWMRGGDAEARVKPYLLPLPPRPDKPVERVAGRQTGAWADTGNYSRSPAEEMEWIARTYMRPGDTFLEVCAGWFTFSTAAALWGYSGEGVDIWETSLTFGRKQRGVLPPEAGTFKVVEGDARSLPYSDGSFGFVYCNPPFYQLETYSDDERDLSRDQSLEGWLSRSGDMMEEMARVATDDALIVTVMADARKDGRLVPLHSLWIAEAERRGLVLHDIVVQHLLSQQLRFWRHAYDARRTAKAHEYVITFKKAVKV